MNTNPFPKSFSVVKASKFNCLLCDQMVLFGEEKAMATHVVYHYLTYHRVGSQKLNLLVLDQYLAIADFPDPAHIDEKREDEEDD